MVVTAATHFPHEDVVFQIIIFSELHPGNYGDLNDLDWLCKSTARCCRYQSGR